MAGKLAAALAVAAALAAGIMLTGMRAEASEFRDGGQMESGEEGDIGSGRPGETKEDVPGSSQGDLEERLIGQFDFEEVDDSLQELFPNKRIGFKETVMGILSGDLDLSARLLFELVTDQLGYAFQSSKDNLIHMLLLAVIAAVFSNFSWVFQSRQISDISFYALYLLLIALALNSFEAVVNWVTDGISALTSFMGVFCPLYFLAVSVRSEEHTSELQSH